MPILFSAVACDKCVLSNFASCDGNFKEIADQVFSKITSRNEKMTYFHGPYLFHYIAQEEHLYFCITDKMCQRSRAFLFLNEIQRRFYSRGAEDFVTVLAAEMCRYSEDYSTITVRKGELDEINGIGVESSETILGEKILYVNNPDTISYSTVTYVGATPERISVSVRNPRFYIIFLGLFILVVGSSVYIFGPIYCVMITVIIAFTFVRSMIFDKNKTV